MFDVQDGLETPEENDVIENDIEKNDGHNIESDDGLGEPDDSPTDYTPNFAFSVRNESKEFDDFIKPFIDSKEKEDQIRELYTRAHGLDSVKSRYEESQQKIADLELERQRIAEERELATNALEGMKKLAKDDFKSLAHMLGVDDTTILGYAQHRLDYAEKPEHERRQIDLELEQRVGGYQRNVDIARLQRENQKLLAENHRRDMESAMSLPEISAFEKVFDSRLGKVGAFREHVQKHGSDEFRRSQKYIPPLVAAQTVYQQFKPLFADALETVSQKTEVTKGAGKKAPRNLGAGRNASEVGKKIKSLADLRKLSNEIARR